MTTVRIGLCDSRYDYLTNHNGNAEDALDAATLKKTMKRVHKLVREEAKKVGNENVFMAIHLTR